MANHPEPSGEPTQELIVRHAAEMDRREQDRADRELAERVRLARRGQNLAFASLVLILAAVCGLGLAGHDWLAGAIGGTYMVSIVGLFLTGRGDSEAGAPARLLASGGQPTAAPEEGT